MEQKTKVEYRNDARYVPLGFPRSLILLLLDFLRHSVPCLSFRAAVRYIQVLPEQRYQQSKSQLGDHVE